MRLSFTVCKLAWRDLRGGLGSLWFVVLQIALGVAMMAAVGSLGGAVLDSLTSVGRQAAGGDLSLRLFHSPATPDQRRLLEGLGTVSEIAELRPVAETADGRRRTLVELKAVDDAWPLYGEVAITGAPSLDNVLDRRGGAWGAAVGPDLKEALGLSVGDRLRLGDLEVTLRAVVTHEPDRLLRALSLGPRVIIDKGALAETGLTPPGAPVYWYYRLRLDDETDADDALRLLTERQPDAGWRIVDGRQGVPGAERTLDLARTLFLLIAMAVLVAGGLGVGNAVRAHVERRLPTAATLKVLGARPRQVFGMLLAQVLGAAVVAALIGGAAGGGAAALALRRAPDWIIGTAAPWQPEAFGMAMAVGVLAAAAFAIRPLAWAAAHRPPEVWRRALVPAGGRGGRRARMASVTVAAAAVAVVAAWTGMAVATAAFVVVCAAAAAAFAVAGRGLARLARRLARGRRGAVRVALINIGRPDAPTVPVTVVLGLSLALVTAVGLTGRAALHHLDATLPAEAPDVFVLSVPPEADAALRARLEEDVPGLRRVETAPFLHARISRLKGTPVAEADVPRSVAWAVRGDRGLSWRRLPRPGTELVAGAWWAEDHAGPLQASVDARVADRLDLAVGDALTLATPAGPMTATVANLRRMDWTALDLDFPIILSPPAEPPPHSRIAAVWAPGDALTVVEDAVADVAPHAPVLRMAPVLEALRDTVAQVQALLLGLAGFALGAAALVLAATVLASARARQHDVTVLRALGVAQRQVDRVLVLEFALLGAAVGLLAVPVGTGAGLAVAAAVTTARDATDAALPLAVVASTVMVMAGVGLGLARRLRRQPLAAALRRVAEE
ncbi:ABC transporter permease [Caenispirillum salinarum]|uniref:ABC transporter permease n=1 Tax=Caenispirillum salinarum TaxID=859058 RepID=UPI00384E12B7